MKSWVNCTVEEGNRTRTLLLKKLREYSGTGEIYTVVFFECETGKGRAAACGCHSEYLPDGFENDSGALQGIVFQVSREPGDGKSCSYPSVWREAYEQGTRTHCRAAAGRMGKSNAESEKSKAVVFWIREKRKREKSQQSIGGLENAGPGDVIGRETVTADPAGSGQETGKSVEDRTPFNG